MAVSAPGLYVLTFRDALKNVIALDMTAATHKVAMFTNSITPNFDTDTAYNASPYNANEVSGTAYVAGGTLLVSPTFVGSGGSLVFDATDTTWVSSTITNARCALIYADGLAGDNALCLINFGGDYSTSNGTFSLQWNQSGIFTIDLTP